MSCVPSDNATPLNRDAWASGTRTTHAAGAMTRYTPRTVHSSWLCETDCCEPEEHQDGQPIRANGERRRRVLKGSDTCNRNTHGRHTFRTTR